MTRRRKPDSSDYHFEQSLGDKACNFFELILKHTSDEWYGKPFELCPWQEDALQNIFGWVDDDGLRAIEMAYLEVVKKSGKTEFVAGILLYLLATEKLPGCQIYGAAAATRQALNVYRAAAKMVEQSDILKSHLRVLRGTNRILKYADPDSFYAAVAADGDFGDGVNPAFVVADELHRWKTRKHIENWDVLSNGGITRRQTLTIAITTAGIQSESPLAWRLHEKTRRIEAGIVTDPKFYGRIYAADKEDDPASPDTWIKANPSLKANGGFLDIEKIRDKYNQHLAEGDLTSFKRYFLNLWDQKADAAIDLHDWDRCSRNGWQSVGLLPNPGPITLKDGKIADRMVRPLPTDFMERFVGRRAWAGVDLSMTTDFSACVFLFPCTDPATTTDSADPRYDPDHYDVLPFFWIPEKNVRKQERTLGVPLRQWAERGFLELTPGEVIDLRDVRARLEWGAQMFSLQEICWDPWNSQQISAPMIDDGYPCVDIRQGYKTLSEPTKKILQLVAKGGLHHGNHPVLRWNAGCAATVSDGRDNIIFDKPDRTKNTARIDGLAALACALTRAMVYVKQAPKKYDVYFFGGS